jgi:hypothetical protein
VIQTSKLLIGSDGRSVPTAEDWRKMLPIRHILPQELRGFGKPPCRRSEKVIVCLSSKTGVRRQGRAELKLPDFGVSLGVIGVPGFGLVTYVEGAC